MLRTYYETISIIVVHVLHFALHELCRRSAPDFTHCNITSTTCTSYLIVNPRRRIADETRPIGGITDFQSHTSVPCNCVAAIDCKCGARSDIMEIERRNNNEDRPPEEWTKCMRIFLKNYPKNRTYRSANNRRQRYRQSISSERPMTLFETLNCCT